MTTKTSAPDLCSSSSTETSQHLTNPKSTEQSLISQQLVDQLHTKLLNARVYTLAHRFTARFWNKVDCGLNLPNTVLAAISGTSAFSNHTILAGISGLMVAALTAINTFLKPKEASNEHSKLSLKYAELRDEIYLFLSQHSILKGEKGGKDERYVPIPQEVDDRTQDFHQLIEKLIGKFNEIDQKAQTPLQWTVLRARKIVL